MKKSTLLYLALGILSFTYVALSLMAPVDQAMKTFHASLLQLRLLQLSIMLPVIAIWVVALWGSLKFKSYALGIIASKDGKALNQVANGLLVLVFGLVFSSTFQAAQSSMRESSWFDNWVVIGNYIDVISVLVAFILIYRGAWKLAALVKFKGIASAQAVSISIVLILGSVYAWMLAMNPYRQSTPDVAKIIPYYLPDLALILTLVIPYLLAWYLGLMAAMYIQMYQRHTPGIIYRKSARYLANGLIAIALSSILIQVLGAVAPSLRHLGLASILALLYVLILVYGFGHMLVATGAKRLAKLEEAV